MGKAHFDNLGGLHHQHPQLPNAEYNTEVCCACLGKIIKLQLHIKCVQTILALVCLQPRASYVGAGCEVEMCFGTLSSVGGERQQRLQVPDQAQH